MDQFKIHIDNIFHLADDECRNGQCHPHGTTSPAKRLSLEASILIGAGVSIFCLICLTAIAVYLHHRQTNNTEKRWNPLVSIAHSSHVSGLSGSSVGTRAHSSISWSSLNETS